MKTKQEGKAEKFLTDFGKKLDQFMIELKDAGNRLEVDFQKNMRSLKLRQNE
ncbi:MAG: hypothetical protein HC811_12985 [Flammeovirgaceae bacterium]|nr:hypothetical protein [Flammeovirgaceae bacterium]